MTDCGVVTVYYLLFGQCHDPLSHTHSCDPSCNTRRGESLILLQFQNLKTLHSNVSYYILSHTFFSFFLLLLYFFSVCILPACAGISQSFLQCRKDRLRWDAFHDLKSWPLNKPVHLHVTVLCQDLDNTIQYMQQMLRMDYLTVSFCSSGPLILAKRYCPTRINSRKVSNDYQMYQTVSR